MLILPPSGDFSAYSKTKVFPEMFVKAHGRLAFYWVLQAGHEVPADVPEVALRMLNRILDRTDLGSSDAGSGVTRRAFNSAPVIFLCAALFLDIAKTF